MSIYLTSFFRLFVSVLCILIGITGLTVSAQVQPGFFEVSSTPTGADILINGLFQGETPALVPIIDSDPGTVIRIQMHGFNPWEKRFETNPVQGTIVPVTVTLVPTSPAGTLEVTSIPSGAMVSLDNSKTQTTPWTYYDVSAGSHLLAFSLSGFDRYVKNVDVEAGKTIKFEAEMIPRTSWGSLVITSSPAGASVYVDGVYSGITNTVIGDVTTGNHQIKVTKAGYDEFITFVRVNTNLQTPVNAELVEPSEALNGSIAVTSDPPGASVFINEKFIGTTGTGQPFEITGLLPGVYQVYVVMNNYEDQKQEVQVNAGETENIAARLLPSPMPQENGQLILNSEPAGADVFIDSVLYGKTPTTLDMITSGEHNYTFSLSGYNDYSGVMKITAGQVLQINTALSENNQDNEVPWPTPAIILFVLAGLFMYLYRRN